MSFDKLRNMLIKHEGIRLKPYWDTEGKLTIGVGRNIESVGITNDEAYLLLNNDIHRVAREVTDAFAWLKSLSAARQDVVMSMVFNMGLTRFKEFERLIGALIVQNYERAADEMLNSKWASQVKVRAVELAFIMRNGTYPF